MTQILLVVAGGYFALVALMFVFQRSILYLPGSGVPGSPANWGVPEMAAVSLTTEDGLSLVAWYRPAQAERATIVYFHGNGGHIGYRGFKARPLLDAGFGLLLVEYRGYGGNPGSPSEEGLYRDARGAMTFLAEQGVAASRVVAYGESLGSGVAVHLAAEQAAKGEPIAAVVLETPLSSIPDVGRHHYPYLPVGLLAKDRFDSAAKIAGIEAPLFIVHGNADSVVPIRYGRTLFDKAVEPKEARWYDGGGHENLFDFGADAAIIAFLDRRLGTPGRD